MKDKCLNREEREKAKLVLLCPAHTTNRRRLNGSVVAIESSNESRVSRFTCIHRGILPRDGRCGGCLWMLVDAVGGACGAKRPGTGPGTFWDLSTRAGLRSQERELGIANKIGSARRVKQLETEQRAMAWSNGPPC